jgi:tetratricopeptide (TPR) repeat protein
LPAAAALAGLVAIGGALFLRSQPDGEGEAAPQMRIAGFKSLSPTLPPSMAEGFQEELTAAFAVDNSVLLVTADADKHPPDLALNGSVRKAGDLLQFTIHLRNERSGTSLWSQTFDQPVSFALAARQVAVHVSLVLRCGLAGAGRYLRAMSDRQLSLWLQYCQEVWSNGRWMPGRILDAARRVTVAAPDFSPGWSSLAFYGMRFERLGPAAEIAGLRAQSLNAAREALRLDPNNGEAYAAQAQAWLRSRDWRRMEAMFQKAISVRPSDCACEFAGYGGVLRQVGRNEDAVAQYRRYHDRIPLGYSSSGHLADALFMAGQNEEAERLLEEALQLYPTRDDLLTLKLRRAFWTKQYDDGLRVLDDPNFTSSPDQRAALAAAFEALRNGRPQGRFKAAQMLKRLSSEPRTNTATATIALAAVGEDGAAIRSAAQNGSWRAGILFSPGFRRAGHHPDFAALVGKLGMLRYWRETGRHPDFCKAPDAPALCRTL